MHRTGRGRLALLALVMFLLLSTLYMPVAAQSATIAVAPEATAALNWLRGQQNADGGFPGFSGPGSDPGDSADAALAFLSADISPATVRREGGASLLDYLHTSAANVNTGQAAKYSLIAVAAGEDPRRFGGNDPYSEMLIRFVVAGDTSLFIRALVLLAVAATDGPERAQSLDSGGLLRAQRVDGGWGFDAKTMTSDTNTTALIVQALVASGQGSTATTRGMAYLEGTRATNDLFPFDSASGEGDANSTACVLQAEIAARAAPEEIARTAHALRTLQGPRGAFAYQASAPDDNLLATLQAVPAVSGRAFPAIGPAR